MTGGATVTRNEKWATWTCVLGWPVQGIWPKGADSTEINAVARSNHKIPDGYHILAKGDDSSKVSLLRYPSLQKGSEAIVQNGHSSHVTNVCFSRDDKYLFSTGGEDNCVI